MNFRKLSQALFIALFAIACGDGGTGPSENKVSIAVLSGDAQFTTAGAAVLDPLQVVVTNPVSKEPVEAATVTWQVVTGSGAVVTPATSVTDENGVATASLRVGSALGTYVVEATSGKLIGARARFTIRAVETPVITTVPASANVGDTITITGSNFSPQGDDNIVLFGGFRGKVVSATTTQLRAVVPICVPSRMVSVVASLGAVASSHVQMEVRGGTTTESLQLARGAVRTISDPGELGCFRLPGGISGYTVLLIPQNYSDVAGSFTPITVTGLTGANTVTNVVAAFHAPATTDLPSAFEAKVRMRESEMLRAIGSAANARPQVRASAAAACPTPAKVGDRCTFQVIDKNDEFVSVTAELKAVSTRLLVYQDIDAPTGGLTEANFQALAQSFDDPIYSADVSAFGEPSDLDANGKIIVLLTPVVNAMTPKNSSGFIAGFFFGCDLVARSVCKGSNGGEIFYTLTADPAAQFSDARSVTSVMRSLPPVLAHEFQHMIHFGFRKSTDALWLSEGLAHHAEDIIADAFAARGDATNASLFRSQNYLRANRYLRDPSGTSLIAENGTGSLELRGAAWLFVKYLVGQHGPAILRQLVQTTESSVTNVVKQTGKPWSTLLANWAVALYADDAPDLSGVTLRPEYTFPNINLRSALGGFNGFALRPSTQTFADFVFKETLPASSQTYLTVQAANSNAPAFSLTLTGQLGAGFAVNAAPQLSILRIR